MADATPATYTSGSGGSGTSTGSSNFSAQNAFAQLTREQWRDYLSRYVPIENTLIKYATSPQAILENVQAARTQVDQSFAQTPGMVQRNFAGLGIKPTAEQQSSINRSLGLQKSLAEVGAMNNARDYTRDLQMGILSGGTQRAGIAQALQVQNQGG